MKLSEFLDNLLYTAILGGIATENPTEDNLYKFHLKVIQLKRECGCHIKDFEEYKKKMPLYYQVEEEGIPMKYAETGRLALKEVAPCCLSAIFDELLEE